jgi:hypothetical protein
MATIQTAEQRRLLAHRERRANWKHWGPYLSERAWGTVREDESEEGDAWAAFPHDQARSRAYRWNEDGLPGPAAGSLGATRTGADQSGFRSTIC